MLPRRVNPHSVIPRSSASDTASELGAPTPTRIGAPATAAFCTSSNDSRPLTHRIRSPSGTSPSSSIAADDLVHRVVAPDVLARQHELAVGVEQAGGVDAAGALERRLLEPVGQAGEERPGDRRPGRQRRAVDRDLLERALAAHAAGGGRVEAALAGVAGQRSGDLDRVDREVLGRAGGVRAVDQALAVEEPERELLVVARRAHRHHERDAVDPDLERLLDRDVVVAAVVMDLREAVGVSALTRRRARSPCRASAAGARTGPPCPTTSSAGSSERIFLADSRSLALSQVAKAASGKRQ